MPSHLPLHRLGPECQAVVCPALQDIERHKQNFGRPGVAHATINYYRAMVDTNTRKPCHELRR